MTIDQIAESRFAAPAAKPTDEIEAALRALVAKDCESGDDAPEYVSCFYCGARLRWGSRDARPHEPDCSYVAAEALIARLDAER